MIEIVIAIALLALIAVPIFILATREPLPHDHPSGVPIPGTEREIIEADLMDE